MIEVNLLAPRAQRTVFPDRFLLPLHLRVTRASFMMLVLIPMRTGPMRYSLKKVIKFLEEN